MRKVTILIVCTANQCRSPVAEHLLRRKLVQQPDMADWQVLSAGTWAVPGVGATQNMQRAAAQVGLDLAHHRAQEVSAYLLDKADLVLVMETGHKEALQQEFPQWAERVHLLSELSGPAYSVADPIGGPLADYHHTVQELDGLIERGLSRMRALCAQEAAQ